MKHNIKLETISIAELLQNWQHAQNPQMHAAKNEPILF